MISDRRLRITRATAILSTHMVTTRPMEMVVKTSLKIFIPTRSLRTSKARRKT
jgi:hypothetical protein